MAKTPIERFIAGEPADRRRRYDQRMREKGFTRMTVLVPPQDADLIKALAKRLREDPEALEELQKLLQGPESGPERTERSEGAPRRSPRPEAHL